MKYEHVFYIGVVIVFAAIATLIWGVYKSGAAFTAGVPFVGVVR